MVGRSSRFALFALDIVLQEACLPANVPAGKDSLVEAHDTPSMASAYPPPIQLLHLTLMAAMEDGSQAEAMVGQLFTMHEEMPNLMNFIDGKDDVRIPELMYLSGHQREIPPTQAYGHADGSARHARQDPSWTASTEGAVSRLLTFVNTT